MSVNTTEFNFPLEKVSDDVLQETFDKEKEIVYSLIDTTTVVSSNERMRTVRGIISDQPWITADLLASPSSSKQVYPATHNSLFRNQLNSQLLKAY